MCSISCYSEGKEISPCIMTKATVLLAKFYDHLLKTEYVLYIIIHLYKRFIFFSLTKYVGKLNFIAILAYNTISKFFGCLFHVIRI